VKSVQNKGESDIMKKGLLSILVAIVVFFVIVLIQTLIRDIAFTEALARPYNYFLAAIAFIGTFTAMSRKGEK
jgi:hypothetical protein